MPVDPSLRYATFPDLATAQSLSKQAWDAVKNVTPGKDAAAVTKYNYPVIGLTDGRYAVIVRSGDVYQGETVTVNGRTFALTAGQIASLATRAGMGALLGDMLPVAVANSRVTAQQMTAINTYNNAHASAKANWNLLISKVIDLQDDLIHTVMTEYRAAEILTGDDVTKITTPIATAVVTP